MLRELLPGGFGGCCVVLVGGAGGHGVYVIRFVTAESLNG